MILYKIIAKLSLPAGEFTDTAAAESISLSGGATGELSVERSGDSLNLTVSNCNMANPTVCLKPEATTFEKEISVRLAVGGSSDIQ